MQIDVEYVYDEAFTSIEPVPKELIETDDLINAQFTMHNA